MLNGASYTDLKRISKGDIDPFLPCWLNSLLAAIYIASHHVMRKGQLTSDGCAQDLQTAPAAAQLGLDTASRVAFPVEPMHVGCILRNPMHVLPHRLHRFNDTGTDRAKVLGSCWQR